MSYLALYRKYRPNNFDDFVGQSEVADIIKNEILNNKISHAYLFSGPRGTGKTSTAKIIARMINCSNLDDNGIPCGRCESCTTFNSNSDIVEIDAASNNGVDEIRELRDKVNLVPTYGKYKIYIIDEVHMLTTQAFNALLKTLEEPPAHVIFILATTEFHKIPVTVVSRCQKFQFLKFSIEDIVIKLKQIADKEGIEINEEVVYEIARLSDGGLRDAINMLDQLSSFKESGLTIQDVYKLNGVISYKEFKDLLNFVYNHNVVSIVEFFENIDRAGKSYERFIEDLMSFLKDILICKNTGFVASNINEKNESIKFLLDIYSSEVLYKFIVLLNDISIRMKNSSFAKILLITEFFKFSNEMNKNSEELMKNAEFNTKDKFVVNYKKTNNQQEKSIENNIQFTSNVCKKTVLSDKIKAIRINNTFATASKNFKEKFLENWSLYLDNLSNNSSFVAIAGMMNDVDILVVGEKNVIFLAQYDSLLERLISNIQLIENSLLTVFKNPYKVVFLLKDEWEFERKRYISNVQSSKKYEYIDEIEETEASSIQDDDIKKIESIFGNDIISFQ